MDGFSSYKDNYNSGSFSPTQSKYLNFSNTSLCTPVDIIFKENSFHTKTTLDTCERIFFFLFFLNWHLKDLCSALPNHCLHRIQPNLQRHQHQEMVIYFCMIRYLMIKVCLNVTEREGHNFPPKPNTEKGVHTLSWVLYVKEKEDKRLIKIWGRR